jgi:hypothetical protein
LAWYRQNIDSSNPVLFSLLIARKIQTYVLIVTGVDLAQNDSQKTAADIRGRFLTG